MNFKKGGADRFKPASFRVGDRVKIIENIFGLSDNDGVLEEIDERGTPYRVQTKFGIMWAKKLELISGGDMDKYAELKGRIEAVQAWDKEADNILDEIGLVEGVHYSIQIATHNTENELFRNVILRTGDNGSIETTFPYTSQYSKLSAFKKALMWLLDHSDIKKTLVDTEQKVEIEGKVYKARILSEV